MNSNISENVDKTMLYCKKKSDVMTILARLTNRIVAKVADKSKQNEDEAWQEFHDILFSNIVHSSIRMPADEVVVGLRNVLKATTVHVSQVNVGVGIWKFGSTLYITGDVSELKTSNDWFLRELDLSLRARNIDKKTRTEVVAVLRAGVKQPSAANNSPNSSSDSEDLQSDYSVSSSHKRMLSHSLVAGASIRKKASSSHNPLTASSVSSAETPSRPLSTSVFTSDIVSSSAHENTAQVNSTASLLGSASGEGDRSVGHVPPPHNSANNVTANTTGTSTTHHVNPAGFTNCLTTTDTATNHTDTAAAGASVNSNSTLHIATPNTHPTNITTTTANSLRDYICLSSDSESELEWTPPRRRQFPAPSPPLWPVPQPHTVLVPVPPAMPGQPVVSTQLPSPLCTTTSTATTTVTSTTDPANDTTVTTVTTVTTITTRRL